MVMLSFPLYFPSMKNRVDNEGAHKISYFYSYGRSSARLNRGQKISWLSFSKRELGQRNISVPVPSFSIPLSLCLYSPFLYSTLFSSLYTLLYIPLLSSYFLSLCFNLYQATQSMPCLIFDDHSLKKSTWLICVILFIENRVLHAYSTVRSRR